MNKILNKKTYLLISAIVLVVVLLMTNIHVRYFVFRSEQDLYEICSELYDIGDTTRGMSYLEAFFDKEDSLRIVEEYNDGIISPSSEYEGLLLLYLGGLIEKGEYTKFRETYQKVEGNIDQLKNKVRILSLVTNYGDMTEARKVILELLISYEIDDKIDFSEYELEELNDQMILFHSISTTYEILGNTKLKEEYSGYVDNLLDFLSEKRE